MHPQTQEKSMDKLKLLQDKSRLAESGGGAGRRGKKRAAGQNDRS
jgi:hypothetical protein